MVEYIAKYLEEHPPEEGWLVYRNTQPATKENCVTVSLNGGSKPIRFLGTAQEIKRPNVLVRVRHIEDMVATQWIERVCALLNQYSDDINGILGIWQQGDISNGGRDAFGRSEKSIRLKVFLCINEGGETDGDNI